MSFIREAKCRIIENARYTIRRELDQKGSIVVAVGDEVIPSQTIGVCHTAGDSEEFKIAPVLGVSPGNVMKYMSKDIGDKVSFGEVIALRRILNGTRVFQSPLDGIIKEILPTGSVVIERFGAEEEVKSEFEGVVESISDQKNIDIAIGATIVEGICGLINNPTMGTVQVVTNYDEPLRAKHIEGGSCDNIIVTSGMVDYELIRRSMAQGVRGIIGASISAEDFLSYVTNELRGNVNARSSNGISMVFTEGFGNLRMRHSLFEYFEDVQDTLAILEMLETEQPGVIMPNSSIPNGDGYKIKMKRSFIKTKKHHKVRVVAGIDFGKQGVLISPKTQQKSILLGEVIDTLKVRFDDGSIKQVPKWNLEVIL